jgi:hypothetical protein
MGQGQGRARAWRAAPRRRSPSRRSLRTQLRRPLAPDTGAPMVQTSSSGVAIAGHTVFVAASGTGNEGYVVAYRLPA